MNSENLLRAVVSVASQRTVEGELQALVDGLSADPHVALVRVWLHDRGAADALDMVPVELLLDDEPQPR